MIAYKEIKTAIVNVIADAFEDSTISDDPYKHVKGGAFIVKVVNNDANLHSYDIARRDLYFDIVYFATKEMEVHELDEVGQTLTEAFLYPVSFSTRTIQPTNITTRKVDMDFHLNFDLVFYDDIPEKEHYEYGQDMEFAITMKELTIR